MPSENVLRIDVPLLTKDAVVRLAHDVALDSEMLYRAI
jgi:hypothetical protein